MAIMMMMPRPDMAIAVDRQSCIYLLNSEEKEKRITLSRLGITIAYLMNHRVHFVSGISLASSIPKIP